MIRQLIIFARSDSVSDKDKMEYSSMATAGLFKDRFVGFVRGCHFGEILAYEYTCNIPSEMDVWLKTGMTVDIDSCKSESILLKLSDLAKQKQVLNYLIPHKWKSKDNTCSLCHGKGERDYSLYEWEIIWDACDFCEGTGKITIPNYAGISLGPTESSKLNSFLALI